MLKHCVIGFSALAFAGAALAQERSHTLKFAHWVPPTHPIHVQAVLPWTKAIEAASGGTLKWTIFPAGQLGKAEDHYDLVRDGIADASWVNPGFNAGRWPVIGAAQIPQIMADTRGGSAAMTEWYQQYASREMGDVKVCFVHSLFPLTFHTKKRITRPEDLKGLKIRPSSAMEAQFIRNFGGAAVPGTFPETRDMLERGVADGTTGVWASLIAFGIHTAVKYHIDMAWTVTPYVIPINKAKYDGFSPAQKKAIDANCNADAARRFASPLYEFEANGLQKLQSMGDKDRVVYKPTAEDLAAWRAGVPAVKAIWAKEVAAKGYDADVVYNDLVERVKKQGAESR